MFCHMTSEKQNILKTGKGHNSITNEGWVTILVILCISL